MRKILIVNLIIMNSIIISSESYVLLYNVQDPKHKIHNISFVAYCIEFLGDILTLCLFGYLLFFFVSKIQQARESVGTKFTFYNIAIISITWTLLIM